MDIRFKKGVVTFIDVLGWKGIWQRKTNAIDILEWILNNARKYAVDIKESNEDAFIDYDVEIISLSDTVVFITEANNSQVASNSMLEFVLC